MMSDFNLPKVSIIIPVYNGENYLKEAIDSALAQTYINTEVIVINDGSSDETESIAMSYGKRIRYYAKENGGVASALNLGIKVMEGEYFSWLSHDDIYLEDKIEKQISYLQRAGDPHKIIFGSWLQKDMQTKQNQEIPPEYRFSIERIQTGVFPVLFGLINGCTLLIHKSHFERVGEFDEKLLTSQDYDFWFRLMRGQTMIYMQEPTVIQRIHEQQGSKTIFEFKRNCEEIQMKMVGCLNEDEIEQIFGGKYKFYYDMLRFAEKNQWEFCCKEFYNLFMDEEEKGRTFKIDKKKNSRLVLYCAGRNGLQLKKELFMKGIDVDYFCDGKLDLHNKTIDGVICLSSDMLKKDDYIIVTKDDPKDIVYALKKQGFKYVIAYSEIAEALFWTVPIKERVVAYYQTR